MKSKCYVLGCKNTFDFRFPQASRQAWLDAIGRPNDNPKPGHGLCAEHFLPADFMPVRYGHGKCTFNECASIHEKYVLNFSLNFERPHQTRLTPLCSVTASLK